METPGQSQVVNNTIKSGPPRDPNSYAEKHILVRDQMLADIAVKKNQLEKVVKMSFSNPRAPKSEYIEIQKELKEQIRFLEHEVANLHTKNIR